MKKIIGILIALALVLSFSLVAVPAAPVLAAPGTTYYVSTAGNDTSGNGTEGNPWLTIQHAINDGSVTASDTINVAAGTYNENVNVNKQLTLTGDTTTPSNVVVDAGASGNAITLSADGIILEGFKATNSGVGAAGIEVNSDNNTIRDNDASGNGHHGILLLNSKSGNTITGNTANNNDSVGIHLYYYNTGNTITGNTANNNTHDGINLREASNGNTIAGNTANDNGTVGIGIVDSDSNIITGNTANDNKNGISLTHKAGDLDTGCTDTTIESNTANHNWYDGIRLAKSDSNTIEDNTVNSNGRDGIRIDEGSDNNTITGNTASGNDGSYGKGQGNAAGIEIQVSFSDNNTLTCNTLTNNQEGILIKGNAGNGNTAHFNNIYDNIRYGIESFVTVDAENNWWGDASGPTHSSNPGGTGDGVSDNVDFDPWLGEAYPTKSVATSTGTGTGTASFTPSAGDITGLSAVAEGTLPTAGKPNLVFPHGFFSFTITGVGSGGTAIVTITLPPGPTPTQYWKYHPKTQSGWIQIPMTVVSPNVIRITLVDGGLGDDDGAADGTIVDQGGPGNPGPGPAPAVVGGEAYPINKVAVLAPWLALLAAIIAGTTIFMRRRRAES